MHLPEMTLSCPNCRYLSRMVSDAGVRVCRIIGMILSYPYAPKNCPLKRRPECLP